MPNAKFFQITDVMYRFPKIHVCIISTWRSCRCKVHRSCEGLITALSGTGIVTSLFVFVCFLVFAKDVPCILYTLILSKCHLKCHLTSLLSEFICESHVSIIPATNTNDLMMKGSK